MMDRQQREKLEARAKIIKALAHPTRLFIVEELSRGARGVGELSELVGDDISTISRHLALLKEAGIVRATRKGPRMVCELQCRCILDFFACVENVLSSDLRSRSERQ